MRRYAARMDALWSALAALTALSHLSLIVLLVAGGPMAVRHRSLRRVHLIALGATGAVFAAGADCPLTVWEKVFIRRSGSTPYDGGFIEHYLVRPITGQGITPLVTVCIVAAWMIPSAMSYAVIVSRRNASLIPEAAVPR